MRTRRRKRRALLLALISAIASLVVFTMSGSSQAEVPPVVDYATYPPDLPGCADGESALVGVQFSTPGATPVSNLGALAVTPGAVVTMTWSGFTPGCEGVGVGLSSKVATVPVFDAGTDYWLYDFAYCGPEATADSTCAAAGNTLSLAVPPLAQVPCYQLDAHLGLPLGQVGPTTNYYGTLNGEKSMLISAQNGGLDQSTCEASIVECATNPAIPSTAYLCAGGAASTTTTAAPPPSTTPTTPTTAPPPSSTAVPSCAPGQTPNPSTGSCQPVCAAGESFDTVTGTCRPATATTTAAPTTTPPVATTAAPSGTSAPCTSGQTFDATSGQCRPVNRAEGGALPATGRDSRSLATTGALLLVAGLCIAYAYRRPDGAVAPQD